MRNSAVLFSKLKRVYERLAHNHPLDFQGGSWRLPYEIAQYILLGTLLRLCQEAGFMRIPQLLLASAMNAWYIGTKSLRCTAMLIFPFQ